MNKEEFITKISANAQNSDFSNFLRKFLIDEKEYSNLEHFIQTGRSDIDVILAWSKINIIYNFKCISWDDDNNIVWWGFVTKEDAVKFKLVWG